MQFLKQLEHLALIKTAVCCRKHAITHIVTHQRQYLSVTIRNKEISFKGLFKLKPFGHMDVAFVW